MSSQEKYGFGYTVNRQQLNWLKAVCTFCFSRSEGSQHLHKYFVSLPLSVFIHFWGLAKYLKVWQRNYKEPVVVAVTGPARCWLTIRGCGETYLAYMICRAESTWDRACCLARFPSRLRRILASDGRLGFVLLCPLILLFTADESLSDWTPVVHSSKTETVTDAK